MREALGRIVFSARTAVVALLFVISVFLCWGIGDVSMLADDAAAVDWGRQMVERDFWTPWFGGNVEQGVLVDPYCRPLTMLSFGIDWKLWGRNPAGWRIESVMLHFLASVLVFFLGLRLLPGGLSMAATAAVFFALHPCHELAFWWITCRNDPLCGLFFVACVLAFLYFLDTGRFPWLAVSLLAGMGALFSKEVAFSLPLVLAAVAFLQPGGWRQRARRALWAAPMGVIATAFLALRLLHMPAQTIMFAGQVDMYHLKRVLYLLIRHFAFPYHTSLKEAIRHYPLVAAAVLLAGTVLLALRGARLLSAPFLVAAAWMACSFLPLMRTLSAWGLYVPSVGLALAAALILQPQRSRQGVLAGIVLAVLLASFVAHYHTRKAEWQYAGRVAHDTLDDFCRLSRAAPTARPVFVTVPASVAGVPIFMDQFKRHLRQVANDPALDPVVLAYLGMPEIEHDAPIRVDSPDGRTFTIAPSKTAVFEFPESGETRYRFPEFHDGMTVQIPAGTITLHGLNTDKGMTTATASIRQEIPTPARVYVYSQGHFDLRPGGAFRSGQ